MNQQQKYHLAFSFVMGAMMISLMTFVITTVNVGLTSEFPARWGRAFIVAYAVGVPAIYFLAPLARRLTARLLGTPI